jgi:hypothetical protein
MNVRQKKATAANGGLEAKGDDKITLHSQNTTPHGNCQHPRTMSQIIAPMLATARRLGHPRLVACLSALAVTGGGR